MNDIQDVYKRLHAAIMQVARYESALRLTGAALERVHIQGSCPWCGNWIAVEADHRLDCRRRLALQACQEALKMGKEEVKP